MTHDRHITEGGDAVDVAQDSDADSIKKTSNRFARMYMKKISKRHLGEWGLGFPQAIEFLSEELNQRGFSGPKSLGERCFFSFKTDTCDTIKVTLSFSRFSQDVFTEIGLFDNGFAVRSQTLYLQKFRNQPGVSEATVHDETGYEPCYVDRLAHRKWAHQPRSTNPFWLMTTDSLISSNLHDWLKDFDQFHMPLIRQLNSDSALILTMQAALSYRKPAWVKSDGPRFVNMRENLAILERKV
jgi:hypothetical protein